MSYLTKEEASKKRTAIKKAFPAKDGWKFSIINEHLSVLVVSIMKYPKEYDFGSYSSVNHFYIDKSSFGEEEKVVLKKINEIMHEDHWDKSDIMTDYFNCSWYNRLGIGKWDRPASSS